jgi:hypothetical protein
LYVGNIKNKKISSISKNYYKYKIKLVYIKIKIAGVEGDVEAGGILCSITPEW